MVAPPTDVGIIALEIYFPSQYVDQVDLEEYDGVGTGKYTVGLGQTKMSFCDDREDINSIAITTLMSLLRKFAIDPSTIDRLEVGTETILDKSKSCKSVLMQFFEAAGNTDVEGIDNLNACYGGDIALYDQVNARPTGGVGCVAMLISPQAPLVMEPARGTCMKHAYDFYKPNFKTEYPHVDGQLSIRCYLDALDASFNSYLKKSVSSENSAQHPKYETIAPYSFTNGSTATNSINLNSTNGITNGNHEPHETSGNANGISSFSQATLPLDSFDFMVFHSLTCKLVTKAYARLLYLSYLSNPDDKAFASITPSERVYFLNLQHEASLTDKILEKTFLAWSRPRFQSRVQSSLELPTMCGNMYCASVWGALISLLCGVEDTKDLIGNRVGVYSYGGGLAATFLSIRIGGDVGKMVKKLDLQNRLHARVGVSVMEYLEAARLREEAYGRKGYRPQGDIGNLKLGTYYLSEVDEQYRRTYTVKDKV